MENGVNRALTRYFGSIMEWSTRTSGFGSAWCVVLSNVNSNVYERVRGRTEGSEKLTVTAVISV